MTEQLTEEARAALCEFLGAGDPSVEEGALFVAGQAFERARIVKLLREYSEQYPAEYSSAMLHAAELIEQERDK